MAEFFRGVMITSCENTMQKIKSAIGFVLCEWSSPSILNEMFVACVLWRSTFCRYRQLQRQRKFGKIKRQSHNTADMQTFQPISEKSSNACICSDTAVAVCCRYAKMQALHNVCIWTNTGVT